MLVYNNLDKRGKFYKSFIDHIVTFEPLATEVLLKYVNKDLKLSKTKAEYLIHICQNNYNKLLKEEAAKYGLNEHVLSKALGNQEYDKNLLICFL